MAPRLWLQTMYYYHWYQYARTGAGDCHAIHTAGCPHDYEFSVCILRHVLLHRSHRTVSLRSPPSCIAPHLSFARSNPLNPLAPRGTRHRVHPAKHTPLRHSRPVILRHAVWLCISGIWRKGGRLLRDRRYQYSVLEKQVLWLYSFGDGEAWWGPAPQLLR